MKRARILLMSIVTWIGALNAVMGQESAAPRTTSSDSNKSAKLPLPVELEKLPANTREVLTRVIEAPTLRAVSAMDDFASSAGIYIWLLDHPDRVSLAWQRLNVAAIDIKDAKDGKFIWRDDQGNEMTWHTVAQSGNGRIWYAEGKIRPGRLLPVVPVKAVAVLRHCRMKDEDGEPVIRQQVEVFLQTDSKTASFVMRLIGPAAPRMAADGADQLLMFFSGIARYVERHPEKATTLLVEKK